jgi:hypothetical protein
MADGFVHTVYRDGNWVNEVEGAADDRALPGNHDTKETAVAAGRAAAISRQTEHVIHNQDGTIGERNSYGNDPPDRPG